MMLLDNHGNLKDVCIGLVDSDGLFLTLLSEADTPVRHYKWSSEAGFIQKLTRDVKKREAVVEQLEKQVDKLTKELEAEKKRNEYLTGENTGIRKKLSMIQKSLGD